MRKYQIILLHCLVITLFACSKNTSSDVVDKVNENHDILKREFLTNDKKTKFVVHNEPELSKDKMDKITDEINSSYQQILKYSNGYEWEETINIYLKAQNLTSYAQKGEIYLYNTRGSDYPLTHELTHLLLGYGNPKYEMNADYGILAQEGFGVYIEELLYLERKVFPNYGIDVHKVMKYLLENDRNIPILDLVNNSVRHKYLGESNYPEMWKAYVHAGSFVKYLFENYKREMVVNIYNSPDFAMEFERVFDQKLQSVEENWINYILTEIQPLNSEERAALLYP
ncbi:hypothetical protein [Cytobacillus praedii]|uniref:hypothetical protein n=1 Tax=Cytobacillus praedii TaxID=1742358 RepID=UPI003AF5E2A9